MKGVALFVTGVVVLLGALIVANASLYIVDETQQVVITQFGDPVGQAVVTPGLKLKVPFIQKANYFDNRFLEWDGDPNQLPTKDKRFIHVDTYARWNITDPLLYFESLGDEIKAQSRLDDILDGETRNTIAKHLVIEVVRTTNREFAISEELAQQVPELQDDLKFGRDVLAEEVLRTASDRTKDLGIEILDFRFKRINYVEEVRREVYARMISERNRIAEQFRSEGAGEAARINGEKDRELRVIRSEAYRSAQEIKGEADARATAVYAKAHNRDPSFYRFVKTMDVYKQTLDKDTVLLLGTDGEFFRFLEQAK